MDYLLLSVSIGLLLGAIVGYDIGKTVVLVSATSEKRRDKIRRRTDYAKKETI